MKKTFKNKGETLKLTTLGFTLIELLAVIVILAIIALISVPRVLNIVDKITKSAMDINRSNMIKATELYIADNLVSGNYKAPSKIGDRVKIELSDLEKKHIKPVYGSNKEKCIGYVSVEKTKEYYNYIPFLDCGNGENLYVDSHYISYGGNYNDQFNDVIKTSDGGYLAVGKTNSPTFGSLTNKSDTGTHDAIIVKYDSKGILEWQKSFGGSKNEYFNTVIEVNNEYIVGGYSDSIDKDLVGVNKNGIAAIVVKYSEKGEIINKKVLISSWSLPEGVFKIVNKNSNLYFTFNGKSIYYKQDGTLSLTSLGGYFKTDENFNEIERKSYGGGNYASNQLDMEISHNNDMIFTGYSGSTDLEMKDIKRGEIGVNTATLFVTDDKGNLKYKAGFGGSKSGGFRDVIEVNDGYIAVGYSGSDDLDLDTLGNKGNRDAVIVKFSKIPISGTDILPVLWKKSFGGSDIDEYIKITKINDSKFVIVGNSKSNDYDMKDLANSGLGYNNAIIIEYDNNGSILNKKVIGGSNSDIITNIFKTNDGYILSGTSFSNDKNIFEFTNGNGEAILTKIDNNLNLTNQFKLPTLLKNTPKNLIKNYGASIPMGIKDTLKLYTTNDPSKEIITSNKTYDPNANYNYLNSLVPFNIDDVYTLFHVQDKVPIENTITIQPIKDDSWVRINFDFYNHNTSISNIKVKFLNTDYMTIEEAVNNKQIEPLVIYGVREDRILSNYTYNSSNLITGKEIGITGLRPSRIFIKQKNKLTNISFNQTNIGVIDSPFSVNELRNFDISLTKS